MKKKEEKRFDEVIRQNVRMEDIIRNQIERVCTAETITDYKWGVKKLYGLMYPYRDKKFPTPGKIEAEVKRYGKKQMPGGIGRAKYEEFKAQKAAALEQYRYEYIFRELTALAKRLGIGLESEGHEEI